MGFSWRKCHREPEPAVTSRHVSTSVFRAEFEEVGAVRGEAFAYNLGVGPGVGVLQIVSEFGCIADHVPEATSVWQQSAYWVDRLTRILGVPSEVISTRESLSKLPRPALGSGGNFPFRFGRQPVTGARGALGCRIRLSPLQFVAP